VEVKGLVWLVLFGLVLAALLAWLLTAASGAVLAGRRLARKRPGGRRAPRARRR